MKKTDKTIKELENDITDLEKDYKTKSKKLDAEKKEKAKEAVEKTKAAINNAIEKVNIAVKELKDDENLEEFLDKVRAKAMEAVDYTKNKIDLIANGKTDNKLDQLADDIMNEFDKVKESDVMKKTTVFLKEVDTKINDFFEKPEVKSAIKKAKITTVDIAEKGVAGLKKVLKTDEIKDKEDK